jgi:hypothetical protein
MNERQSRFQSALQERQMKCRRASNGCFQWFVISALVVTVGVTGWVYFSGDAVFLNWKMLKPWLGFWRLFLFMSLIGCWPYWVHHFSSWAQLQAKQRQWLLDYRWRFAVLLLLIDVILVQDWLVEIIQINLSVGFGGDPV